MKVTANMKWEDIQLFEAAASAGSLTGAAKKLKISQPQISRRIRQLEDHIGARLFDRTPHGLLPTRAGEKLIPLARNMRTAAEAVARIEPDLANMALGVVRINADEVRARFLTLHMPELLSKLDGIEIEFCENHAHLNHTLRETEIQLRSCLPESETLIARRLGIMTYALYGSHEYVHNHQDAIATARYCDCDWIGLAPDRLWYPEQKKWLDTNVARPPRVRFNAMTSIYDACVSGVGLAILPCFIADTSHNLVRISGEEDIFHSVENLIVHRDLLREPAVRKTVDAIVALYKRSKSALTGQKPSMSIAS